MKSAQASSFCQSFLLGHVPLEECLLSELHLLQSMGLSAFPFVSGLQQPLRPPHPLIGLPICYRYGVVYSVVRELQSMLITSFCRTQFLRTTLALMVLRN